MPKLPKNKPLILAVSAVILIFVAVVIAFVINTNLNSKKSSTTKPNPIKSNFSGSVVSVNSSGKTFEVKNSSDNKIYKVKLDPSGTVTALGYTSSFENIKVSDQIVIY